MYTYIYKILFTKWKTRIFFYYRFCCFIRALLFATRVRCNYRSVRYIDTGPNIVQRAFIRLICFMPDIRKLIPYTLKLNFHNTDIVFHLTVLFISQQMACFVYSLKHIHYCAKTYLFFNITHSLLITIILIYVLYNLHNILLVDLSFSFKLDNPRRY